MATTQSFQTLIARMRAGDSQATAELARRSEPAIRLAVRAQLTGRALRRLLDPDDICQMVLADFFVGAMAGRYEVNGLRQLFGLLRTMARYKLTKEVMKLRTQRRGGALGRVAFARVVEVVDPRPDPSELAAQGELLNALSTRLPGGARRVLEQRLLGRSWAEVAAETGDRPDAVRMMYSRAIKRVGRALGLESPPLTPADIRSGPRGQKINGISTAGRSDADKDGI